MFEYQVTKVSERIMRITDEAKTGMYLVTGNNSAALIDTGTGLKGLKELVEKITDLPYIVLLTHGHGDHAGGCGIFPEVYLNSRDIPVVYKHGMDMRTDYVKKMMDMAAERHGLETASAEQIRCRMVPEPEKTRAFKDLKEGMTFDLGGLTIEVIEVPGHTKGSCCFLFREERSVLLGDACNPCTLVSFDESTTVSEYKESLAHLLKFEDRYDTILFSHKVLIPVTKEIVRENLRLCEKILAGQDAHVPVEGGFTPGYLAAAESAWGVRADGGVGNIMYSDATCR